MKRRVGKLFDLLRDQQKGWHPGALEDVDLGHAVFQRRAEVRHSASFKPTTAYINQRSSRAVNQKLRTPMPHDDEK